MKHEVIGLSGRRFVIKPDPLNAGMVHCAIYGSDKEMLECISLTWDAACVASYALEIESKLAFDMVQKPVDIGTDWQAVNEVARGDV